MDYLGVSLRRRQGKTGVQTVSLGWQQFKIEEIAASERNALVGGPFGSNLVSKDYTDTGVPVIRGQNMGGRWVSGAFAFVSLAKANSLSANKARPGDLVFTQRGTLGQVSIVPSGAYPEYIVSQSQMKLTPDLRKVDVEFLYYLFQTEEQQRYIQVNAVQNGVPHTNLTLLKNTPVRLPSLGVQQAIASALKCFDTRMELLTKENETLEAMARAIFKSWFVDFDPVRAKAEGREPEGMDAATAALFPSEFQDSELGPIPSNWAVASLDSVATFLNGLALQKFPVTDDEETLPAIKIAQLRARSSDGADRVSGSVPSKYIIGDGDLLFSWSGSLEVDFWCEGFGALNQHLFKVSSDTYPRSFYYLWLLHHLPSFREIAAHKATTMGHIQRVHLTQAKVVVPSPSVLEILNRLLEPFLARVIQDRINQRTLRTLRDTLLPRLISGKLRVPEAEAMLAEVI